MTEPEDVSDEADPEHGGPAGESIRGGYPGEYPGYEFIGIQRDKLKVINLHLGQSTNVSASLMGNWIISVRNTPASSGT